MHKLGRALEAGRIGLGLFSVIRDPNVIELLGCLGYDFVVIDMEHSALDLPGAENLIRAAQLHAMAALVRTPRGDLATVARVLDAGADGVMIPHVSTPQQAAEVVAAAKYHPVGTRGVDDANRAARFGTVPMAEHMRAQNAKNLVIAMIEDGGAVQRIDEILAVKGLDALVMGTADLAADLGVPNEMDHPSVVAAKRRVFERALAVGLPVGMSAWGDEAVAKAATMGARLITVPDLDMLFLSSVLGGALSAARRVLGGGAEHGE